MAGLQIHQELQASGITMRLEGTLDGRTAALLCQSIEAAGTQNVMIDFGRLREFKDAAVFQLTQALSPRTVTVRGLGEHHQRVFRYLGGMPAPVARRAYYTPEEVTA